MDPKHGGAGVKTMKSYRMHVWSLMMLAVTVFALVVPAVVAQAATQTGVTVQREVTIDAQGNRVVTERTFRNGALIQVEVKTFSPLGLLLRKVEETFVNGRLAEREVTVFNAAGQVISKTEFTFDAAGQIIKVEETAVTLQNGLRVKVEREFRLVNGVLTLMEEERQVLQGNQGPGNLNDRDNNEGPDDNQEDNNRSGSNSGSH